MMGVDESLPGFAPLTASDGKIMRLAMQELRLTGEILPMGARLMVRHVFVSEEKKPIEVIYAFALPRDAALRQFRITGKGFSVHSELRKAAEAEAEYEHAILSGSLAGLTRVYGDGIVNLTVGNIRPGETVAVSLDLVAGVELHDTGFRFRFPFTLAPGYHAKARVAETGPGEGEIELPEEFGDVILPTWRKDATGLHSVGFNLRLALPAGATDISSPSHRIHVQHALDSVARVSLATDADIPDRDLVLDVETPEALAAGLAGLDRQGKGRFAAVIPSRVLSAAVSAPRRVVFVVDRSGSMDGTPMAQARTAVEACLGALSSEDRFGIVAFDDRVETLAKGLIKADSQGRRVASAFLQAVDARGGTELAAGIEAAVSMLSVEESGDILVVTDGQVMGGEDVIARARQAGAPVYCLGIGSASQDRFLALLSRETGGTSRFLTPRERVDRGAVALFAAIGQPVAKNIRYEVRGTDGAVIAPPPPLKAHAGVPVLVYGSCPGAGDYTLHIAWESSRESRSLDLPMRIGQEGPGETLRLLQGARLITDAETHYDADAGGGRLGRRSASREDRLVEALSLEYGLASRCTALVAVVTREGDSCGELPQTQVVPVGMPEDTSFGAYFAHPQPALAQGAVRLAKASPKGFRGFDDIVAQDAEVTFSAQREDNTLMGPPFADRLDASEGLSSRLDDRLMEIAAAIEPDGGLPGSKLEDRILATVLALIAFLDEGSNLSQGTFSEHVKRLAAFLEHQDLSRLRRGRKAVVTAVLAQVHAPSPDLAEAPALLRSWAPGKSPNPRLWRSLARLIGG